MGSRRLVKKLVEDDWFRLTEMAVVCISHQSVTLGGKVVVHVGGL